MEQHCKPGRSVEQIVWSISKLAMHIAEGKECINGETMPVSGLNDHVKETIANCVQLTQRYLKEEVNLWLPEALGKENTKDKWVKKRTVSVQITNHYNC